VLLIYLDGDYEATWTALESGEVHIWPEVWTTEDGEKAPACLVHDIRRRGRNVLLPFGTPSHRATHSGTAVRVWDGSA
jgi:hypothetical protein